MLFRSYYVLLSSPRNIANVEEFVQLNMPWLSLYPYDKSNAQFLKELAEKITHALDNRKEYEAATERLFVMLQKNLHTQKSINEAETEWSRLMQTSKKKVHVG